MSKTLPLKLALKSFFFLFLFLSNGLVQAQTLISYPVDNSATDYILIKAVGLPGGKSAVIYRDAGYNYKCSIVGSNGTVTGTFDFTSKMTLQNIPSRIEVNALGTSSGNIWITYTSSASDGPPSSINARYLVLDQSGNQVYSGTVNGSNLGTTLNRYIRMDQLSNGNVVMVWLQSDNMSGGYRIFQPNGTPVTSDASFAGPASSIFTSSNLYGGNMVAANPNGGFLITFYYYTGNFRGILFDNNGAVQQVGGSNTFTIDPANYPSPVGSYTNISALGLSNGNYMIAWAQNSGGTNRGYYKIISATGSTIKAQTIFPPALQADISTYSWVGAAANNTSSSPGFVIADYSWQDYDDLKNPYAKAVYYNFDLNGNSLSSQDASPYFIAHVNGPTVSVYSGNPSGVGVVYTNYKSYTPNGGGYTASGADISGSLYGFGGASLSNNAALSNLTLSSGTLSPAFASGTISYTASVSNATSAITLTPTVAESHATVTVNNTAVTSGSASGSIPLVVGANTITVKVTAQDGTTTSTYTITVTRAAPPGVLLSTSPTITFTNSTGFGDNIAEDGEGGSTAISDFNLQVMPVNSSGAKLTADPLQYHSNADWSGYPSIITYGDANPHYGWSIKSDNGAEFSLVSFSFLDWGDYGGHTYVAEAFYNGSSLGTIQFTGNSTGTMVELTNATQLTSIFRNVDEVRVYRQGGIESWIALNNIRVTTPSPIAIPTVTTTSATAITTTSATLGGNVTADGGASVTARGIVYNTTGTPTTADTKLSNGSGTGSFTQNATGLLPNTTYYVRAYATNTAGTAYGNAISFKTASLSSNANLSNLVLNTGTLNPTFASGTTSYAASVCNATSAITVTPTVADANATVTVNNTAVTSGSASGSISLAVGANAITVKVVAQDGVTAKTYTITITRAAVLSGTTVVTNVACNGGNTGSIDLTPTGGTAPYTYNWSDGITTQDRTNLVAGSYSVTITDANGCTGVVNVTLSQPSLAVSGSATITNVSCNGGSNGSINLTPSGGVPPYTYNWGSGITTEDRSGLTAGTYIVTITDNNGCTATRSFTVNQPAAALVTSVGAQTNVFCNGGANGSATVNVTGGTPGYSYSWAPVGGIGATATGLVAGTYTVTVIDANACTATQSVTITQPTALTATTSQSNVSCNGGSNGTATVTASGGSGSYSYSWAPVGGTAATASGLAAGTYTVTVTDANLCSITRTFTISQPAALTVSSISLPANGTYTGGDDLDFTIAFNQTVTVDPAGGTPYINLTLASGTTRAHYAGGSGTNSLTFRYTVGANDQDPDGIGLGNIFSSGGLIQYASGCAVSDPIVGIPPATGIIIRNPVAQTITFNPLANKTYGDTDFGPGATASSGLAVSYTSSNTAVATIVAGKIHIVGAGSTIITATQTGNSNYLAATAIQQTLTVNPAMLTITADNQSKVYGAAVPVLTASYSGFVNGDDASSLTTLPVLVTGASAISPVGNYAITVTGAASSKYTIIYVAGNYAVTPATLTITANNQTKTYGAGVPALTASYSGFVNGDNPSSLTVQPILTTIATTTSMVGNYTILVGGAASANYTINYVNGSLTVLPAPLTITATNVNKTYGQTLTGGSGSTAFISNGLMNGETIGSVTIAYGTGASATDAVDTYTSQVTASAATGGTFNPANYSITYANGDIKVGAAASTISFAALPAKTYGDADFAPGASSTNSATAITYTSSNTSVATIVSGKIHIVGAGTAIITASQAADANHTAAMDVVQQLTVNKAVITVVADAKNKIYGESDPALTYHIGSGALVGADSFSGSLTRAAGEDAGNYAINQGTLGLNGNYTLTYNAAALTINKAAITVIADARIKIYGQSDPALTYQISSGALVGTDAFTGSLTRDAGENAGSYAIKQGTLALNTNYSLTYTGANLTINKAALTITAEDKTKAYGQDNPAFTASYSGFVNGDNASGLAVQPTLNTTATTTSPVGNYVITASGAADPNYTISYVAGNLSVAQAALTITADTKTKVYGEADPALTYSITGLVAGDAVTGSLVRTPGEHAGSYAIQQGSLSASGNYLIRYQEAGFTITPKPVTVTADAQTKIYGQPDPLFTYSVSPVLLNGDVLNGALSRTAGENAGTYAINQGSLNNPDYALSFTGNALTINKAAQQITWVQSLSMGCDGVTRTTLTATAGSGLPVSYSSADASIATVNNNEVVMTGAGTVVLTASQPGNQNYLPASPVTNTLVNKLPSYQIVKRWDDVLVFDNSSNQYIAWQWYKNGVAISGATGQYYYESGKLNGDYYAFVKTAAGVTMQTCPVTITPGATFVPISIFPNPAAPGQTITVKTGYSAAQLQGATIVVTNMLGAVVQTVQNVAPQTTITMPFAEGLYAVRLKLANGVSASVNVLVKPQ